MSAFLSKLCLEAATDKDDGQWVVSKPLIYKSDIADATFCVHSGFVTDLASVPRVPILFWLTGASSSEATALHDWLYTYRIVNRRMADDILYEASAITGVPVWRRWIMWAGVRLFGAAHY